MKKYRWLFLSVLLLAIVTVPFFGCITIVSPPDTDSTYTIPADQGVQHTVITPETSQVVINSFMVEPSAIEQGASVMISWNVSGATSVSIDQGIGAVGSTGLIDVTPSATTVFTLTASNGVNTQIATAQVVVSSTSYSPSNSPIIIIPNPSSTPTSPPVIHLFTAEPEIITDGELSLISWSVFNATSVAISPAIYRQLPPIPASGSAHVSPSETTTYTLTATNAAGMNTQSVTVTVKSAALVYNNWEGTWKTDWGMMQLTQSMGKVTGTYTWDEGKIVGYISKNLTGDMLAGTWSEKPSYAPPKDAGDIMFIMDPDFNSFTGNWRYGSTGDWSGSWIGTRVTEKVAIIP